MVSLGSTIAKHPNLFAWFFNVALLRLETLLLKIGGPKFSSLTCFQLLFFAWFDVEYMIWLKQEALSLDREGASKTPIRWITFTCLFNIWFRVYKMTSNHFERTTADMQPPPVGSRHYSEATEERRLVSMHRVSYTITPIRKVREIISPYTNLLKNRLGSCLNLLIPSQVWRLCKRLDAASFDQIRQFIDSPTVSLHPNLPTPTVREAWGILSSIIQLSGALSSWYLLILHLLVARYSNLKTETEFIQSLIHHDALKVDNQLYQMRKDGPWWSRIRTIKPEPAEGSNTMRYNKGIQFVGFTFYNSLEIKAKADHLLHYMPEYDHLVYNCQAFQHNLRRRIVAHEFHAEELSSQPASRGLDAYRNQRGNSLILGSFGLMFLSPALMWALSPLRYNYLYKLLIFLTCTWHGKPASNRVALTQLLAAYVTFYMFDITFSSVADSICPLMGDPVETMLHGQKIELQLILCGLFLVVIGLPVKYSLRRTHNDTVYPMLGWHQPRSRGYEGKKVSVRYLKPDSGEPVDQYRVTIGGLVPIVKSEVLANMTSKTTVRMNETLARPSSE